MQSDSEHKDEPLHPVEALAETWEALAKFAAELARQIAGMGRGGQRGFRKNVEILEAWLRAALLQLAEQIELPKLRRKVKRQDADPATLEDIQPAKRRPGFRAIDPDAIERHLAASRGRFDISQFGGHAHGPSRDARERHLARLEAIGAALEMPEFYARRVKRKLEARSKRPPMKLLPVTHGSALPDLARASPHSDLGRMVWYNDTS